jgi:hypothetical protein
MTAYTKNYICVVCTRVPSEVQWNIQTLKTTEVNMWNQDIDQEAVYQENVT